MRWRTISHELPEASWRRAGNQAEVFQEYRQGGASQRGFPVGMSSIVDKSINNKKYTFPRHFPVKLMQSETLTKY